MKRTPRFRLYLAISLDGFIASPDGGVSWLDPCDPYSVGFGEFLIEVGGIVMGRKSYEQALSFDSWPWGGKHIVVMTRRGLAPQTPDTEIASGPAEVVADRLRAEVDGDIWIFGGAEVARAFLQARRCDTLELCIVPHVLGAGIALFGPGTPALDLARTRARHFDKGLVCLDYAVKASG
jgi:dihydrofolate reductase